MGLYLQHQRRGLPADGEGPLQLQTHRGTTGGAEDLDLDLKMRLIWLGPGSNMLFNFTKRADSYFLAKPPSRMKYV